MKICVILKDFSQEQINHKRPTTRMLDWDFSQLLNYIKEELYWQDINEEDIEAIQLISHSWIKSVARR